MPRSLELCAPGFERVARLADGLIPGGEAEIALRLDSGCWSSRTGHDQPPGAEVLAAIDAGRPSWIPDQRQGAAFFASAPIHLAIDAIAGVLILRGPDAPADRARIAAQLSDLAELLAEEFTRALESQARAPTDRTLQSVLDAIPTPMMFTDRELRVLFTSRAWHVLRGGLLAPVIGRTMYEIRPEVFERLRPELEACLDGTTYALPRLRVPGPDGRWVSLEVVPWRTSRGEIGGLIFSAYDITELVEAFERSNRSEERLQLAMSLAELYVYELDLVRRELVKVGDESSLFERAYGFDEFKTDIWSTVDPRDRDEVRTAWLESSAAGRDYRAEFRIARKDEQEVWAAGTAQLIYSDAGKPLRLVGVLQNITNRKTADRALVEAKEEAEAANHAKSAFLAAMSHEIRTPLNGVLGMAQAMANDPLDVTQRERLEVIRQSGESLLAILNDVLDLSKVEAGKLRLEQAPFKLDELVAAVHGTFAAVAEAKGLDFTVAVEPGAEGVYEGDSVRVRQILWNLVANALKFTERGAVKVTISQSRRGLTLRVADTGIGIAKDRLRGLFQKFEQEEASTARRFGGTGLGLAICRELAELMGGDVRAESVQGKGSTFIARLPLKRAVLGSVAAETSVVEPRMALQPALRVLAAEDNATNQLVLKALLAQVGIEPVLVENGRAAVQAWERESWDLILMDVQMPVMDGPAATAEIRRRERTEGRARTPIVALTANAMAHQVSEYLSVGMDAFVAKPIEAARLYEALQAAIDGDSADTAVA